MARLRAFIPALGWAALGLLLLALSGVVITMQDSRYAGTEAPLTPELWLPLFRTHPSRLIEVSSFSTGVPLAWFALAFAGLEAALAAWSLRTRLGDKLLRPLLGAAGIFVVFWSFFGHLPLWDLTLKAIFPRNPEVLHPTTTVVAFAGQHLELILVSSLITVSAGLLLGILVTRAQFREFLPLVSDLVSSAQTVPTLAIIAIMAPIIGFGFWPAIIALVAYGILPVVRNTIAGLEAVDPFMVDSARGMGMTPTQILWQIEVPTASRVILAGVRTSVVINVGTAALGAFVGSGGLGVPIAAGLNQQLDPFVLLGAIPAALLAILVDYVLGRLEYVLTPTGLLLEG